MTDRVTPADLMLAAEWLTIYEGDADELAAMRRVIAFLDKQVDRLQHNESVRVIAKERGVSVKVIRGALRKSHPITGGNAQ
jgi:hypothetical protein